MCKLSFFLCDSMWCFEWNLCRCILLLVYICIGDTFQEGVGIPLPVYPATLCICHKQEPGFPMPYVVNIFKINYLRRRFIVPFVDIDGIGDHHSLNFHSFIFVLYCCCVCIYIGLLILAFFCLGSSTCVSSIGLLGYDSTNAI